MKEAIPAYPSYQNTGLPWASRVPDHWEIKRLKYLVRERVQKGFPNEPLLAATQTRGVIPKSDYGLRTVEAQKDLHLLKLVEPGDYVISLRSFQGGIEFAHYRGIISPAYTVLWPTLEVRRSYFEYFFKSASFVSSMSLFVTGIREGQNIDYVRLSRAYMPLPPPEEQEAIGRFIRYIDQRVNRLFKAKRRLIELLNEQKQAIIHGAVTRGLDTDVPLKLSGVEWLGDVPEHWEVKRMRYACRINPSMSDLDLLDPETSASFLPMKKVGIEGNLVLDENRVIKDVSQGFTYFRDQDVIVAKITPCFENGKAAVVNNLCNGIGFGSTEFHVLRANPDISPLYIYFIINSRLFRALGTGYMYGAGGQKRVPEDFINNFVFAFPPLAEQKAIVTYIKHENAPFDDALRKVRAEIDFIREYRARLVSDVVTGQLDVRGLALPEVEDEGVSLSDDGEGLDELADEEAEGAGE